MDLKRLNLVGISPAFREVTGLIKRVASTDAPVLAVGETGTGKELIARAIHYLGRRKEHPFVPINCGALPETLVESELFGHERGAFTDARQSREGLIARAQRGTLFLDEVDSLGARGQVALLRFLEDQHYRPVGSACERSADVRVIAAASAELHIKIDSGNFRPDLYYRLRVLRIDLPPLRIRNGDALLLAEHFLKLFSVKYNMAPKFMDPESVDWLQSYAWPGNVRELENLVLQAFLLSEGDLLRLRGEVPLAERRSETDRRQSGVSKLDFNAAKQKAISAFERHYLEAALVQSDGNVTRAAYRCGKERRAFGKLLKKYGISPVR